MRKTFHSPFASLFAGSLQCFRFLLIAISFLLFFLMAPTGFARTAGPPAAEDLAALIRVGAPLDFCGEPVPLQAPGIRERLERELLISLGNRPQVILWIKRSARHLPYIEKALKENDMPDDLKYIVIAESALIIHARSVKGATGVWQFMEATGVRYQLKINDDRDERLSFFAATRAALDYLKDLHALFGSWTLAAAAYNMGESGLKAEMLVQKIDNYYRLYLPLETQRYIFRILSVKLILSHPARYGFHLTAEDLYAPDAVDPVEISLPREAPIQLIAEAAKTDFKVIKDLNPEIRGYYLPEGIHRLLLPAGSADGFQVRLTVLFNQWLADRETHVYVVKEGDSLSSIAERFALPLQALLIWNRISAKKMIHPGDRLVILPNRLP
ncbi:MAG: lytic transglycosylase [Syntrophus sp. (in: bacteria)]|nr:lytic transglycosylase [Syntrophus sp. (in: bacteria)]